jgi:glycosyltransferase involved in cell wall biosynthesis
MRILHVIDKLSVGGAERVFVTLTALLKQKGVDVNALVFEDSGDLMAELNEGLHVHNLNRKNKYSFATIRALHKICAGYDIVHVHMRHCFIYTALAKKIFNGKYKLILHDHYGDVDINQQVPLKLKLLKPDVYIGVSTSLQNWAIENWNLDEATTHVLKNTVLPTTYKIIAAPTPDVCMIANFRKTKNIEFAISLFKKLDWPLTIYGRVNDKVYYEQLVSLIDDAKNIKLVTTAMGFNEINSGHNFAIHTATSESGPLVLLEYMSAGIPFVAYNTGEVAKTVHDELGYLFMNNFTEQDWIDRMQQIKNENLSTQLKDTFTKYFNTDKYISDCLKIYQSVLY